MPRGSKPGERRGGRKKGTPNRRTKDRQAAAERALASGATPLDYMLAVMRDENASQERRDEMAKAAAPYVHPRLTAMAAKVNDPENPWEELMRLANGKSRGLPNAQGKTG